MIVARLSASPRLACPRYVGALSFAPDDEAAPDVRPASFAFLTAAARNSCSFALCAGDNSHQYGRNSSTSATLTDPTSFDLLLLMLLLLLLLLLFLQLLQASVISKASWVTLLGPTPSTPPSSPFLLLHLAAAGLKCVPAFVVNSD